MKFSAFYGTHILMLFSFPRNKLIVSRHPLLYILFSADIGFAVLWNPNFAVEFYDGFDRIMILESEI